jgi:hypothetical protein
MFRIFTKNGNRVWIDMIDNLIYLYNKKKHSIIKTSPSNAYNNNIKLLMNETDDRTETKPKFKVDDRVRVSYNNDVFDKGYHVKWTHQIYLISEVLKTKPTTYKVKDERNNELLGSFYDNELQLTKQPKDVYPVEKIIKSRTKNGKKEHFVKFQGYDDSWNEWLPANQVEHNLKNINKL